MKKMFRRVVVVSLVVSLVFCSVVSFPDGKSEVYAATSFKPSENAAKYIKEAVSAGILDKDVYTTSFDYNITKIEAVKYAVSLFKFLGGNIPTLPVLSDVPDFHPFKDTQDSNVEIAAVLGIIPANLTPPPAPTPAPGGESGDGQGAEAGGETGDGQSGGAGSELGDNLGSGYDNDYYYEDDSDRYFQPEESIDFAQAMQLIKDTIVIARPSEVSYVPTATAALASLKKKYSNASDLSAEYLQAIGYLSARNVLLLSTDPTTGKGYLPISYWSDFYRESFFVALDDAAWALDKAKMKPYLAALAKPKIPKPYAADKYSRWNNYHYALKFKNNLSLSWESVAGAFSYKASVYASGKKKKDIVVSESSLYLSKISKPTYKSVYGNNTKRISSYVYVAPMDRHGNVGPKLKISFNVEKYTDDYQKIYGKSGKYQFKSVKEAKSHQTAVKVKVWRLRGGKKVGGTAYLTVNKAVASDVVKIFDEIYKGDEKFPINGMGGFAARTTLTHEHASGTAIDINPNENYMIDSGKRLAGSFWSPKKSVYSIKPGGDVVKAFEKYGWYWAGYGWHGGARRDYMHFSYFGT